MPNDDIANVPAEADVARVVECVCNHPRHRELLYKALAHAKGGCAEPELIAFIEAQPEYAEALQEAFVLVRSLKRAGGVAQVASEPADADAGAGVPAVVRTTPAGVAAVGLLSPQRRIAVAVEEVPQRAELFRRILGLCAHPRTLAEIKQAVGDDPALAPSERTAHLPLEVSYFIDRLAQAGALAWESRHWVITEEGARYLASA